MREARPFSLRGPPPPWQAFVVARGFALPSGFPRGILQQISTDSYSSAIEVWTHDESGGGGEVGDEAGGEGSSSAMDDAAAASDMLRLIVPFVACGDLSGWDADANYALDVEGEATYVYHEPTQKPTTPAYRAYLEAQRAATGSKVVLDNTVVDSAPEEDVGSLP